MGDQTPQTGIKNADELISLAAAYGLTVTVETTDRETITAHVVRISIPVPTAYAGTELGRAISNDTLTMLWTRSKKAGRGRLDDATAYGTFDRRKLRTQRAIRAHIETMGRDSNRYARETAPQPEDVVDAPHALYIDGQLRKEGIPAAHVRTIVKNRRFRGWHVHQDDDHAIVSDNRRYVPATSEQTGAPAAERYHFRSINGGTPVLIPTREALAEINHAMMGGRNEVREMSETRGHARIVYKNPERGTVELRRARQGDTLTAPAPRQAAEVLTADPIPAGLSVLEGMPGQVIAQGGRFLANARNTLVHEDYVMQLRSRGVWILPNHDDKADITRGQVVRAIGRTLDSAPTRARASLDTDGTVYLSNGYQAARYIPAALIAGYSAEVCPGCDTPYAVNGDGPCADMARLEPAGR